MVASWICEESPNPAKKEDELLYFRGPAALVFVLGCEESRNPAKKGERMSFLY
jgi:hypothetical protein